MGMPAVGDLIVQQAAKLMLEPIFEAESDTEECVTMPGRPSVSRKRENRTYGPNGERGNVVAMRRARP